MRRAEILLLFGLGLIAAPAAASNRYAIDHAVAAGRLTGFIETNGATGALTTGDIVDWDLSMDADGSPETALRMVGPHSGSNSTIETLYGDGLTATPSALSFDFGRPGALVQICTPNWGNCWVLNGDIFQTESISEEIQFQHEFKGPVVQVIGTSSGPSFALGLTATRLRINDLPDERLRLRALFDFSSCGDGFDLGTEAVSVSLANHEGTFYPTDPDVFPLLPGELVLHETNGVRSWSLSAAGRQRTGIERLEIDEAEGTIVLVDRGANLPAGFYERTVVEVTIGNDSGQASATLTEEPCGSNRWRAGR